MIVMSLCLFIYNYAQYRLRTASEQARQTVPNQKGKPTKHPTMRWVFQLMKGIGLIKFMNETGVIVRTVLTNMNDVPRTIIRMLGGTTCKIYGIQSNFAGM